MVSLTLNRGYGLKLAVEVLENDLRILVKVTSFIATHNSLKRIGSIDLENI